MPIITTTLLPAAVQRQMDEVILSTPVSAKIYNHAAVKKSMKGHSGSQYVMRRYSKLAPATVPLGPSGGTPPGQTQEPVDIVAKIDYYGTYLKTNEQVILQANDKVLNAHAIALGVSLRETEDMLTRDMLVASAASIDCRSGNNGDMPTNLTYADATRVVQSLVNNDAKTIMSHVAGENRFGTAPVFDAFLAMCNAQLITTFAGINEFKNKNTYANQQTNLRSEWGSLDNLRFLVSSDGAERPLASFLGASVFPITCSGMEAYATIKQDNYTAKFIYRPPELDGPLAQNITMAYKMSKAQAILQDLHVINLNATI